jgi:hypothetical protein
MLSWGPSHNLTAILNAQRAVRGQPEVPTGSMIVPGKHQTQQATRRQPTGSMSWSRIRVWHHLGLFLPGPTGPIRFRALLGRTAGGPNPPDWLPEPVYNPPVYNLPVNNTAAKYKAHSSCTTPHHSLQLLVCATITNTSALPKNTL